MYIKSYYCMYLTTSVCYNLHWTDAYRLELVNDFLSILQAVHCILIDYPFTSFVPLDTL